MLLLVDVKLLLVLLVVVVMVEGVSCSSLLLVGLAFVPGVLLAVVVSVVVVVLGIIGVLGIIVPCA